MKRWLWFLVKTWQHGILQSYSDIDSDKRIVDLDSNDLDIDFEKASKGKQVSSSNAAQRYLKQGLIEKGIMLMSSKMLFMNLERLIS